MVEVLSTAVGARVIDIVRILAIFAFSAGHKKLRMQQNLKIFSQN